MDKGTPQTHPSDEWVALERLTENIALRKRIAELEAVLRGDLYAQSLAKHQAFETVRSWEKQYAELKAQNERFMERLILAGVAGNDFEDVRGKRIAELERKLPLMNECVSVAMENLEVVRQELDTLMGDRR